MYSKEEIIARLAKGEDAQAIADEIAVTLNSALSEHLEDQEKKAKDSQKAKDARTLINLGVDFMKEYYPDVYEEGDSADSISDEALIEMLDKAADELRAFKKTLDRVDDIIDDILAGWDVNPEEVKVKKIKVKEGDPIADFLAKYVNN